MYLKIREYRAALQEANLSAFTTSNNRCEELKNIELQVTRNQSIYQEMTLDFGSEYSRLPSKCGGTNKHGGWKFYKSYG